MSNIKSEVAAALQEMLAPKKTKKKTTPKFILVVNGAVLQNRPATKKDLIKAAKAIVLRNPEATIEVYKFSGEINVDLPVSGPVLDNEEGA